MANDWLCLTDQDRKHIAAVLADDGALADVRAMESLVELEVLGDKLINRITETTDEITESARQRSVNVLQRMLTQLR